MLSESWCSIDRTLLRGWFLDSAQHHVQHIECNVIVFSRLNNDLSSTAAQQEAHDHTTTRCPEAIVGRLLSRIEEVLIVSLTCSLIFFCSPLPREAPPRYLG